VEKAKVVRTGGGGGSSAGKQARVYLFVGERYYKREEWEKDEEDLEEGEGFYVLLDNRKPYLKMKDTQGKEFTYYFSSRELEIYKKMFKNEIYGIVQRYADKIGSEWTSLETKLREKMKELENDPDVQNFQDAEQEREYKVSSKFYYIWNAISSCWEKKLTDQQSIFYRYLAASKHVNGADEKIGQLTALRRILHEDAPKNKNKSSENLKTLYEKVVKDYPMLIFIEPYRSSNAGSVILDYINLIDEKKDGNSAKSQAFNQIVPEPAEV
jgi:hypothetical protein